MTVMNDIGELLFDKSMRNETRLLQDLQGAVFDVFEKASGEKLDLPVRFIVRKLLRRRMQF